MANRHPVCATCPFFDEYTDGDDDKGECLDNMGPSEPVQRTHYCAFHPKAKRNRLPVVGETGWSAALAQDIRELFEGYGLSPSSPEFPEFIAALEKTPPNKGGGDLS